MIGLIGLSYKSAPVEIREKFVFNEKEIVTFTEVLKKQGIEGTYILSTCNRTELYIESYNGCCSKDIFKTVLTQLKSYKKADISIEKYFYFLSGTKVFEHLFHVTSGLDSMALGEYQIVGQIKEALVIAEQNNTIPPVLLRMVQKSLEAGKEVRTKTNMSKGAMSVSYAAVELARQRIKKLSDSKILLVGAGQTGELVVQNLVKKGAANICITNRTTEKATELAERYNGNTIPFESLKDELHQFDIILTSTGSKKPLINKKMVQEAIQRRNNEPMIFIDLSVPRNVSETVENIEHAFVYDIDCLETVVKNTYEKRKDEIADAQQYLNRHILEFEEWLMTRKLAPAIQSIATNFKEINDKELEGFKKNNKDITEESAKVYGDHITNKFIRLMIKNVRSVTDNGKKDDFINVVNQLFQLSSND